MKLENIPIILDALDRDENLRRKTVQLFESDPGYGKSEIIEQWAKDKGKDIVHIIGSQVNPTEITGIAVPDYETGTMAYLDNARLANMKDGDVLFLDELWQSPKQVLQAMLTLLQGRRLASGKPLADVIIVAAANPVPDQLLNQAIIERFTKHELNNDKAAGIKYLAEKYSDGRIFKWIDYMTNKSPRTVEKEYLLLNSTNQTDIRQRLSDIPVTVINYWKTNPDPMPIINEDNVYRNIESIKRYIQSETTHRLDSIWKPFGSLQFAEEIICKILFQDFIEVENISNIELTKNHISNLVYINNIITRPEWINRTAIGNMHINTCSQTPVQYIKNLSLEDIQILMPEYSGDLVWDINRIEYEYNCIIDKAKGE